MRAKSAMNRKVNTTAGQLQHQNQKNKILEQDRKIFLKQADEIKQKNNQEIHKLKIQNRKLRALKEELIKNKKKKVNLSQSSYPSFSGEETNFSRMDENYLRIMLDKEKHETKIKKNILYTLQDKLKQVEDNKLSYIEENPMMRTIRLLQNRLDKVMIKYNEAQSIHQTYQQVVKRLNDERVGYDSELAAIQNCLKGKQHDFQQLLLLAHDASHAKQAAIAELKRFEQRRITVQQMRSKYKNQKITQISHDIPEQGQNMFKMERQAITGNLKSSSLYQYKDENYAKQELNDYEQAFRRLKEVTGVTDANEIIQKFKTQGLTTKSLEQLQSNYGKKIDCLKTQKEKIKKQLQDHKYSQNNGNTERRRLDQIETDLAHASNQLERLTLKYNKSSTELINIKAGIDHLKNLTKFYKVGCTKEDENIQQILQTISTKLKMMFDVIKNDPNYKKNNYSANVRTIQNILKQKQSSRAINVDEESNQQN